MKWYLMWFWFAFPWWLVMLSIFSCVYWPFAYLPWRTVHSDILPIFKLNDLSFNYWVLSFLYIMDTITLSDIWFSNIFFHSVICLFTFSTVSFEAPKYLTLVKSNLPIFSLATHAFGVISKNSLPNPRLWHVCLYLYLSLNWLIMASFQELWKIWIYKLKIHNECGTRKQQQNPLTN